MKCVCTRKCPKKIPGSGLRLFLPGEVFDFDECPPHFEPVKGMAVDFNTASKDFLLNVDFDLPALKDFIKEKFDVSAGNRGKEKTIDLLVDARMRHVEVTPNKDTEI